MHIAELLGHNNRLISGKRYYQRRLVGVLAEVKEQSSKTAEEEFAANFIIMTETIDLLINDLLRICEKK